MSGGKRGWQSNALPAFIWTKSKSKAWSCGLISKRLLMSGEGNRIQVWSWLKRYQNKTTLFCLFSALSAIFLILFELYGHRTQVEPGLTGSGLMNQSSPGTVWLTSLNSLEGNEAVQASLCYRETGWLPWRAFTTPAPAGRAEGRCLSLKVLVNILVLISGARQTCSFFLKCDRLLNPACW